jgi:hypothetical protein
MRAAQARGAARTPTNPACEAPYNIGLIMAATPVNVFLIAWYFGLEKIKPVQLISVVVALTGVALILFRGSLETLASVNFAPGDIIVLIAMLGWAAYNLLEVRAISSFILSNTLKPSWYCVAAMSFPASNNTPKGPFCVPLNSKSGLIVPLVRVQVIHLPKWISILRTYSVACFAIVAVTLCACNRNKVVFQPI